MGPPPVTPPPPVGPRGDHASPWRRVLDDAAVVLAAEMIGVAEAANALALDYAQAREAANRVTAECLQIHGGVGYTWDNDSHLLLRRAKVDDMLLGAQGWQRERLADAYFAGL